MGYPTFSCLLPRYFYFAACWIFMQPVLGSHPSLPPYLTQRRDVLWWVSSPVWMAVQLQECSHCHLHHQEYAAKGWEVQGVIALFGQHRLGLASTHCESGPQVLPRYHHPDLVPPMKHHIKKKDVFLIRLLVDCSKCCVFAQSFLHRRQGWDTAFRKRSPTVWLQTPGELHLAFFYIGWVHHLSVAINDSQV